MKPQTKIIIGVSFYGVIKYLMEEYVHQWALANYKLYILRLVLEEGKKKLLIHMAKPRTSSANSFPFQPCQKRNYRTIYIYIYRLWYLYIFYCIDVKIFWDVKFPTTTTLAQWYSTIQRLAIHRMRFVRVVLYCWIFSNS